VSDFDIAITGAGMAGASLAAALAPHRSVLLLEGEDQPGYHSTGRSAAFWDESYGGPGVQPLTSASFPALSEGGFLRPRGALHIAQSGQQQNVAEMLDAFADSPVRMEELDRGGIEEHVPGIRAGWDHGVWEPDCRDIDVGSLHAHYLSASARAGATLQTRASLRQAQWTGGEWLIETAAGAFSAALLVNAAGAWADVVALSSGVRPCGIRPFRRSIAQIRTRPAASADLPLILGLDGSFYFKPDAGGRLWLSPHDEVPSDPCDAAPEEIAIATAIARFEEVVDWTVEAVERRWAGLRSFAPDRLPVIGRAPDNDAFFWFAGQGGFGIQTAPAAAALAAYLILGSGKMPDAIEPARYSPARFA